MKRTWIALFLIFPLLHIMSLVSSVEPASLSDDEYVDAYMTVYSDYLSGGEKFSKEEVLDLVDYYLQNEDVAQNLNSIGPNSGRMIGSILADAGVDFECGACNEYLLNKRCCIYLSGSVPMAYECIGTEVMNVKDYTWKELWQCTYGCCGSGCCGEGSTTTTTGLGTTTSSITTTSGGTTTSYTTTTSGTTTTSIVTTTLYSTTTTSGPSTTATASTTTTNKPTTSTSTTIPSGGTPCTDCCRVGDNVCQVYCKSGSVYSSSNIPITICSYDGFFIQIERGSSISLRQSCVNARCPAGPSPTTSPVTTTTSSTTTTFQPTTTTLLVTTTYTTTTSSWPTTTYTTTTLVTTTTNLVTTTATVSTTTTTTTTSSSTTSSTTTTSTTTTIVEARITMIFVPVDWTSGQGSFDSLVDEQVDYLLNVIPLKACPENLKVIKLPPSCTVNVPVDWNSCFADAQRIFGTIENCAKASGEEYDYIIGISGAEKCESRGFSSVTSPVIYMAEGGDDSYLTHELGHQWELNDEYYDPCRCFPSWKLPADNCLDASIGGSDPFGSYPKSYCAGGSMCGGWGELTCFGNKNPMTSRCLMGFDYIGVERDWCPYCKSHLSTLSFLKC